MSNILIVYHYYGQYPPRATIFDHLYCFERYSAHRCFYLNLATSNLPRYIKLIQFDLIVFHTIFLSWRWQSRVDFEKVAKKVDWLKQVDSIKIALPQDEFTQTDVLCDFINDFGIDYVFSVAPETEWSKIYPTIDFQKVKFFNVLTGYLDEDTVSRIKVLAKSVQSRPIDIGYRAWGHPPWLGRYGFLKTVIADCVQEKAPQVGLVTDISTRAEDTFVGDDWYKFLLSCKYTLGVESGAGILDRDGTIKKKTNEYLLHHPQASFDEVEAACFPNLDGSLHLFVVSPRHLEACATRTCQILIEGTYNGILVANKHYIQLKRDFSNIDQILTLIKQDRLREEIAERAYHEIVGSGRYTYRGFVEFVFEKSLENLEPGHKSFISLSRCQVFYRWNKLIDKLSWIRVAVHWYCVVQIKLRIRKKLVNIFSEQAVITVLRRIKQR